jgi:hypothetical protein
VAWRDYAKSLPCVGYCLGTGVLTLDFLYSTQILPSLVNTSRGIEENASPDLPSAVTAMAE